MKLLYTHVKIANPSGALFNEEKVIPRGWTTAKEHTIAKMDIIINHVSPVLPAYFVLRLAGAGALETMYTTREKQKSWESWRGIIELLSWKFLVY